MAPYLIIRSLKVILVVGGYRDHASVNYPELSMCTNVAATFHIPPSSTAAHPETSQTFLRPTPDIILQQQQLCTTPIYSYQTDFPVPSSSCSLLQPICHPAFDAGMSNMGEWGFGLATPDTHISSFSRPSSVLNRFLLSPTSPQMNVSTVNTMPHPSNDFRFSSCGYYGTPSSDNQWQM